MIYNCHSYLNLLYYAELAQLAARQSHNLKVASSNLAFGITFCISKIYWLAPKKHYIFRKKKLIIPTEN